MKQILEALLKSTTSGIIPDEYRYHTTYISDKKDSYRMKYTDMVVMPKFTKALANYLWNHCPKAGGKKPKVVYPEGQLNYTDIEDLEIDIMNLTKASIDDGVLKEFLECIYQKNIQQYLSGKHTT